jgi:hypothetical protein
MKIPAKFVLTQPSGLREEDLGLQKTDVNWW